jgi:hypothetical protein
MCLGQGCSNEQKLDMDARIVQDEECSSASMTLQRGFPRLVLKLMGGTLRSSLGAVGEECRGVAESIQSTDG